VKNTLGTLQSIMNQTRRRATNIEAARATNIEAARAAPDARIVSLARA